MFLSDGGSYESLQLFKREEFVVLGEEGGTGDHGCEGGMALYVLGIEEGLTEGVVELISVPNGSVLSD